MTSTLLEILRPDYSSIVSEAAHHVKPDSRVRADFAAVIPLDNRERRRFHEGSLADYFAPPAGGGAGAGAGAGVPGAAPAAGPGVAAAPGAGAAPSAGAGAAGAGGGV